MRGCASVLLGLLIGAALSFAALAILALAVVPACPQSPPTDWRVRLDVPRDLLLREAGAQPLSLPGAGTFAMTDVRSGRCGHLIVRGEWHAPGDWSLSNVGIELAVEAGSGALLDITQESLWLGRLPLPLGWLPRDWTQPYLRPIADEMGGALDRELGPSGLRLCGVVGSADGLSAYLCDR